MKLLTKEKISIENAEVCDIYRLIDIIDVCIISLWLEYFGANADRWVIQWTSFEWPVNSFIWKTLVIIAGVPSTYVVANHIMTIHRSLHLETSWNTSLLFLSYLTYASAVTIFKFNWHSWVFKVAPPSRFKFYQHWITHRMAPRIPLGNSNFLHFANFGHWFDSHLEWTELVMCQPCVENDTFF